MAFSKPVYWTPSLSPNAEQFYPSQDVCRYCNHLRFCKDFDQLHIKESRHGPRTEISGTAYKYTISIHTYHLLTDVADPEHGRRPRDCRYCAFVYDALSLFFVDSAWNWKDDAMSNADLMIHIDVEKGEPMLLRCNDAFRCWHSFTSLRSVVEIYCLDRSALKDSDLPCMSLTLPEPAGTPEDLACEKSFCKLYGTCAADVGLSSQSYYVPNKILYLDGYTQEVVLWEKWSELPGLLDIGQRVDYATLCHGWLPTDPRLPRLLKANIDEWRKGVSFIYLPPAILDAVRVCVLNGITLLWVDSLCIVQDDECDLQRQLPVVGHYFRDSILTIAAASASSADDRFLSPPRQDWITKQIEFEASSGARATITLRRKYSRPMSLSEPVDSASARANLVRGSFRRAGQLYRRDWCFQQLMLATRTLHFTSAGVMYECKHHDCTRESVNRYRRTDVFTTAAEPVLVGKQNASWLSAIQEYASLVPSGGRDRLTAVAGLAACSELAMLDRYVAGLWKSNLLIGLLWEVRLRPGQKAVRRITFPRHASGAPSFSWASVNSGVEWEYHYEHYFRPIAKVVEVSRTPRNCNPYLPSSGAFVRLNGPLKPCTVGQAMTRDGRGRRHIAYVRNVNKGAKPIRHPFVGDGPLVRSQGTNAVREILRRNRRPKENLPRWSKKCPDVVRAYPRHGRSHLARYGHRDRRITPGRTLPTTKAFILGIGTQGRHVKAASRMLHNTVDGLVLTRSTKAPNSYKRIGCIKNLPIEIFQPLKHQEVILI
ncbi:hypothetical protein TARUN_8051 [Trichoderma arundinaceum]|uniref:Heterokaryon incompatibility domain-containing protein n=1 Tax=Trichoderma arundinaceum TaxID=490622 RepID=A0A395NDM1_TRIAR|nr:hypothetical protein TARUN_8051 [Trichoderma arundinaceum]